ncbi:MAG: FliA/WhiG family RNA polymerase sigma factor [bacterium]
MKNPAKSPALKNGAEIDEKELELWRRLKEDADENARQTLAERYLGLVKWIVERVAYRLPPNIDREDLISEGILGLLDAIDKFDHERMSRFESYAAIRIRGQVLDYLRQQDWLPRTTRQKCREIEKAFCEVERKLGRSAGDSEVAEFLGIDVDDMNAAIADLSGAVVISFEETIQSGEGDRPIPIIARIRDENAEDPGEMVVKKEIFGLLKAACERLPENEKTLISLYYVENLTLKEIGEALDISESRACQLHAKALMRLKSALE